MLMGAHHRRVHEEVLSHLERAALSVVPPWVPHTPTFPAAEAVIDGIPAAKLRWHITPGKAGAGHIEDRFDDHLITEHGRATRGVLDQRKDRGDLFPSFVRQE
jgi:hypothetical protein